MMETNPHASGVDDIACLIPSRQNAFGVDDGPLISLPFPVPFSDWVGSAEHYWSILAKRRSALVALARRKALEAGLGTNERMDLDGIRSTTEPVGVKLHAHGD